MKRLVLAFVVMLAACTEHGKGGGTFCSFMGEAHTPGEQFPAGDGCNNCECLDDGTVTCTELACPPGVDGGTGSCVPSGFCQNGPECGGVCCGVGESCIQGLCTCGGNAPCSGGDICASAGPIGNDSCGSICCGGQSNPCPL